MTEAEWSSGVDPAPMIEFVRSRVSSRKLRLFACACCRTVWPAVPLIFQEAIRVAEEHVDGRATDSELGAAVRAAHRARGKRQTLERAAYDAARSSSDALGVARDVARAVAYAAAPTPSPTAVITAQGLMEHIRPNAVRLAWDAAFASHLEVESALLRDIVGPLLFRSLPIPANILTWSDGTVVKLAHGIYDKRAFERLPVLADALEEAGCDNADILDHYRQAGPHARGCWALDLILGKE